MRKWELIKKANYWRLKVKFSETYLMKSMGSSWENLTIQLGLKGLISFVCIQINPTSLVCTKIFFWKLLLKNKASRANLNVDKRVLKSLPFFNLVYFHLLTI